MPGRDNPVFVFVGLAGNGTVARTILESFARQRCRLQRGVFLARARADMKVRSAVYELSGPASGARAMPLSQPQRGRFDGLHDEPRRGAPRTIADASVEAVIAKTLAETPTDATH